MTVALVAFFNETPLTNHAPELFLTAISPPSPQFIS
jgi:hypothetical protein